MKKGSSAAKAWGRKMRALRFGKPKRPRRARRVRQARIVRRAGAVRMARRGRKHFSRKGGMGSGGIMSIAKSALIGYGASRLSDGYAPQVVPYQGALAGAAAGYLLGGKLKGAIIGGGVPLVLGMLANGTGTANTGGNGIVWN